MTYQCIGCNGSGSGSQADVDLRDKMGTAIVIVTHNMGVASKGRLHSVMQNGELKEFGTREQVIYHPENDYTKKLLTVVPKLQGETDGE